jgi:hypothetical protein
MLTYVERCSSFARIYIYNMDLIDAVRWLGNSLTTLTCHTNIVQFAHVTPLADDPALKSLWLVSLLHDLEMQVLAASRSIPRIPLQHELAPHKDSQVNNPAKAPEQ